MLEKYVDFTNFFVFCQDKTSPKFSPLLYLEYEGKINITPTIGKICPKILFRTKILI